MQRDAQHRELFIKTIITTLIIILIIRAFYLQIIDQSYKISAKNNAFRFITDYPERGDIYDRNGEIIVSNEAAYDLMVVPREVKNIDTNKFCELMKFSKEEFISKLERAKQYSPYVASAFENQISKKDYAIMQEVIHLFKGFYFKMRTIRKYIKPVAVHAIGYIGEVTQTEIEKDNYYKPGDFIGITGIEKYYEKILRGEKGIKIRLVDNFNRDKGSYQNGRYDKAPVSGINLYTTLDIYLQEYAEKLLDGKRGSLVAIEPSTGEILAIVSVPSYDPNLLVGRERTKNYKYLVIDNKKPLFNRALMSKYPPGSTFKLVNALIGLQENVVNVNTTYGCSRGFYIGGLKVGCHEHPTPLNLIGSIQNSCNAYYCNVFNTIINNRKFKNTREGFINWRNHVMSFGFGNQLGIDLPNEGKGYIPTPEYYDKYYRNQWNWVTIISLSIGQGEIGVTPLQLANLTAIIANKGYYYEPHIVKYFGIKSNQKEKLHIKHTTSINPKYFDPVIEGMYQAVENGTATYGKINGINICGKTGTAQNPHGKDHSLFICFAPKENPKIAISVVVENAGFGATWAVPIASLLIEKYLTDTIKRPELEERILGPVK